MVVFGRFCVDAIDVVDAYGRLLVLTYAFLSSRKRSCSLSPLPLRCRLSPPLLCVCAQDDYRTGTDKPPDGAAAADGGAPAGGTKPATHVNGDAPAAALAASSDAEAASAPAPASEGASGAAGAVVAASPA